MKKFLIIGSFICITLHWCVVPSVLAESTKRVPSSKKSGLAEELIAKEKEIWDAYKHKDTKALGQLLADDYYAIEDADGKIMSKTEAIQSVRELELKNYEMQNLVVIEINDGSAIVRYKVKMEGAAFKHEFVPQWSMVSSVWAKRAGKWQNLMYQETKISE